MTVPSSDDFAFAEHYGRGVVCRVTGRRIDRTFPNGRGHNGYVVTAYTRRFGQVLSWPCGFVYRSVDFWGRADRWIVLDNEGELLVGASGSLDNQRQSAIFALEVALSKKSPIP